MIFAFVAMAAPMVAGALPAGGQDITMPGFTIHSPGTPWLIRDPQDATNKDGSLFDDRLPGFAIDFGVRPPDGSLSSVYLKVRALAVPTAAQDIKGALAEIKKGEEASLAVPSTRNRQISASVSETVVAGNACVRTDVVSDDLGVPGHQGEAHRLAVHGLKCPHPEFPSFVVSIEYSTRVPPGGSLLVPDQDGYAVQNSLRFAHLGYRVTQIPVGELPQMLTEADGAIWVAFGAANGKVARIDPKTNAVVATIPVGKLPIGITSDASGVWVANRDDNTVMQIDPKTNAVVKTVRLSGGPQQLAAGAGAIWVASLNGPVWRIDPVNGTALKIRGVGDQLAGIAVANGQVYVADYQNDAIVRIDPATNAVAGRIKAARFASHFLADGNTLWASIQEARPKGPCPFCSPEESTPVHRFKKTAVLRIDTAGDHVPVVFSNNIGNMPRGIAMWRGKLWVANWTGATLSVIDPAAPLNTSYFPIGLEPESVIATAGALWVTVSGLTKSVMRIDPE